MAEAFDTLTAAEKLQNGGFSDDQSKAIAHVIGDAITGNVATKSDVENLQVAIHAKTARFSAVIGHAFSAGAEQPLCPDQAWNTSPRGLDVDYVSVQALKVTIRS